MAGPFFLVYILHADLALLCTCLINSCLVSLLYSFFFNFFHNMIIFIVRMSCHVYLVYFLLSAVFPPIVLLWSWSDCDLYHSCLPAEAENVCSQAGDNLNPLWIVVYWLALYPRKPAVSSQYATFTCLATCTVFYLLNATVDHVWTTVFCFA